jgi:hypothetical protein
MNHSKNPYCAFTPSGGRRGSAYSARWYKRAFQRIYILMHGGTARSMSARLRALRLPGVAVDLPPNPYPNMTVVWNPLAVGVPNVPGNDFRNYYPGSKHVDAYGNNVSIFNGPAGGAYDLGTKPRSRAAYRRFIVPLSG